MPIVKSHQVSRLWLVSFFSSDQFTGLEVVDTPPPPPGMNRSKEELVAETNENNDFTIMIPIWVHLVLY